MRDRIKLMIAGLLIAMLSACGGGGGGGGDESSGTTGVRVLHGAIDAVPVELVTDTSIEFQSARYGDAGGYRPLGGGTHLLTLYPAKSRSEVLLTQSVVNAGDQKFTVLFFGNRDTLGLQSTVIAEDRPEVPDNAGLVRGIHAVGGAGGLDFVIGSATASTTFGKASSYVDVAAGIQPFLVRRAADRLVLARGSVTVEQGRAYTVFAGGEAGYLVSTQILDE